MRLVHIDRGTFEMGFNGGRLPMGALEVTNAQYAQVLLAPVLLLGQGRTNNIFNSICLAPAW